MRYRELGKTGINAGIIGLGPEHLDGKSYELVKEVIDAALENQINMMDLFMPGSDIRQKIGRALKGRRDKIIIQGHIGSTDVSQQYDVSRNLATCQKYFDSLLKDLQTDYIDFGMLFFIDSEQHFDQVFNSAILGYVQNLKRDGIIRGIGASSHNPVIAKKMAETGILDILMFSVNLAFDMIPADVDVLNVFEDGFNKNIMLKIDDKRAQLYRTCEQHNVSITVMKTLGGGKLLSSEHTPFSKPLTVRQCIHYALTRPAVASVLVGCQSRAHVEEAIAYLNTDEAELDYTEAIRSMNKDFTGSCVYCNHCLPCPANIDIAAVTKYLDIAAIDKSAADKGVGQHYRELSAHGSDCLKCGSCESRCPFSVQIMQNMDRAAKLFSL